MAIDMFRKRLKYEVLEHRDGPYRNGWFLVEKKSKSYRLINPTVDMNQVTIRDANMPPSPDEFVEGFTGCQMASMIDFFSGYDQVELDVGSRDMIAFQTPLGLLWMTKLPQGATNSPA